MKCWSLTSGNQMPQLEMKHFNGMSRFYIHYCLLDLFNQRTNCNQIELFRQPSQMSPTGLLIPFNLPASISATCCKLNWNGQGGEGETCNFSSFILMNKTKCCFPLFFNWGELAGRRGTTESQPHAYHLQRNHASREHTWWQQDGGGDKCIL